MLLSYRIPLITGILLILTALVNIYAFQFYSTKYFQEYIINYQTGGLNPDPEQLQAFLQLSKLDKATQDEYAQVIGELSNLSTSLENLTKNPELYMTNNSGSSDMMLSLPYPKYNSGILNISQIFYGYNLKSIGKDTPEGRLVTEILKSLLSVNLIWLFCLSLFYFFWIRSIFVPIQVIIENLEKLIQRKSYTSIQYQKKNEFFPLISTINNLHKSLSIQEKIRSDFLSDLSHEIRTPITAVKCYLEGIEDGVMKLDKKTIGLLQSELIRLTDITGKIMDYEHLTRENFQDVQVERFSLKAIITNIVHEYSPQLEKNQQTIIIEYPRDTMTRMDKNMYIQILHNIFSNFLKYAGENTTLVCSYKKEDHIYVLTFSDNGIGIPDEELDFVKEKFYRVDKGRTQSEKSMGIGLSIIEHIARLHRGSLLVQKNHPQGVIFEVRIGR